MEFTGTPPKGADLLKTLIALLEEQEGVKITYEIEAQGAVLQGTTER